jgi:malonyl-CoA/methylmalonyl-CoA synthetase
VTSLCELFDASLKERCEAMALEFHDQTYTFGELESRSNRVARWLIRSGFEPGDRLCVYLANCVEMIDVYLACIKTGIIFVPINILYRNTEITHILRDSEPRAVISDEAITSDLPVYSRGDLSRYAEQEDGTRPSICLNANAPAGIIYTSGTTGTSKGAVLTQGNFAANAENLLKLWRITANDRFLLALPLFHVHALGNGLHCWLRSGCRMRLLERFAYQTAPEEFLRFRPTLFFGVPTVYVRLLDFDPDVAREIGSFMRLFVSGSAPLPAKVFGDFQNLFGHTILERYGMSETLMIMSNPYEGERRAGTVGFPLPGIEAKLLNEGGSAPANGETGEIYLRGPNVFSGYWKREEATRASFVNGFFRTGDLATRSPDGYYTLCGRKSDVIISGGFNIYPREIEEFLQAQPEIAEAAIIGVSDSLRGEVPIACIVPRDSLDTASMEKRCRDNMASFKVPRKFVIVDKLPRNALGKIQKHLLPRQIQ